MWSPDRDSSRRGVLAGLVASLVAGCGFTPVYGPGGAGHGLRGQVALPDPRNAHEVRLMARLEDRLGAAGPNARFALTLDLALRTTSQGINPEQETTRVNIIGELTWRLQDRALGTVITTGVEQNFTSYSTTANTAATLAAEEDAEERLMVILADQLTDALLLAAPAPGRP